LRAAFIADAAAYRCDVLSFVSQDTPRLLKAKLLLVLKWTRACYVAEPLTKTRTAHSHSAGQIIDSKRLVEMLPHPYDGDAYSLRRTVRLCHAM
jgi:hypothetical protein